MKQDYKVADLQRQIDMMDNVAYDQYCNLQMAIDALNQIVNVPYTAASDSRAVKEMVRIATEALDVVVKRPEQTTQ